MADGKGDKETLEAGAEKECGRDNVQEILLKHDNCCQVAKKIDLKSSESQRVVTKTLNENHTPLTTERGRGKQRDEGEPPQFGGVAETVGLDLQKLMHVQESLSRVSW